MRAICVRALAIVAGLGLLGSVAVGQQQPSGELKQMKLTEKHIQGYIAAQKQLAPLSAKLEAAGEKADPALVKQVEQIAKSNGFATLDELGQVGANISIIIGGLDPQTGNFTEPPDQIKRDIEEIKQDKEMSQQEKNQALADMNEALKTAAPIQFKENIALVRKYQRELDQVLGQDDGPEKK